MAEGTTGRLLRPTSLFIEARGVDENDKEVVVRMSMEPATSGDSPLTLAMTNHAIEDWSGFFLKQVPTGEHDVTVSFVRCRFTDPV